MSATPLDRSSAFRPRRLRCENLKNPLGIDVRIPRLSWMIPDNWSELQGSVRGMRQCACRILVASTPELLAQDQGDLWDSGRLESEETTLIEYAGVALGSRTSCHWKVTSWLRMSGSDEEIATSWSEPAEWSMGLLEDTDWSGSWIGSPTAEMVEPAPMLRKTFVLDRPVKRATAYICGLGYYELSLNGEKVGDHLLDPKVTRYDRRVLYVTYDVTRQLAEGANAMGVMLGNGWYNYHVRNPWDFDKAPWRDKPKMLLQLEIEFEDGTSCSVVSDGSWKYSTGPIQFDGILNGEIYDARREVPGWDTPGFDDAGWEAAKVVSAPEGRLVAQMIQPIRVVGRIKPVSVTQPQPGIFIFDLGQNIAGTARINVNGPAGTNLRLRYAELLHPDGTLNQTNINTFCESGDFQTEHYILKGEGTEQWNARFMYYGFQFVEVTGYPGELTAGNLEGLVIHSDVESAGGFECSNDLLNKIHRCNLWSFLNNFHGYPTDCPNREKIGWTGDAHIAVETGLFNLDPSAIYAQWIADFGDEQQPSGELPGIIPTGGWGYERWGGPAWCSALILIPWYMYLFRGDVRILSNHYAAMVRYMDFLEASSPDGINDQGMGDWFPSKTETPVEITSTGYYHEDALVMEQIARVLGKPEDAAKYRALGAKIRNAFHQKYFDVTTGQYGGGAQTANAAAIYQKIVPDSLQSAVVQHLVESIRANDDHLDCGILGAKFIPHALTDHGHVDLAYRIASGDTFPSWGDMVRQGATTLWEGWDVNIGTHNHVMLGDISAWFYRALAGIMPDPNHPGFKSFIIRPRLAGDLEWVKAHHDCPHGRIISHWTRDGSKLCLDVTVPVNSTARIHVPTVDPASLTESGNPPSGLEGIEFLGMEDGAAVFMVRSGSYHFRSELG